MKKNLSSQTGMSKLVILAILGGIAAIIFAVVLIIVGAQAAPNPDPVTLTIWGVWDESTDLDTVIKPYQTAHPYISIKYKKLRFEEYERLLLEGWATDTGPDIFALPSNWVASYQPQFLAALPKTTKVAFYTAKKTLFKTDIKIAYKTENSLTTTDLKSKFVDVVTSDAVVGGKIYTLPLSLDSMVMYYNRDFLNQAHLAEPPVTWSEVATFVSKISLVNEQNDITRSGAALGTYDNIPHATDILSLLMMQNGATMSTGSKITFNLPASSDSAYYPGSEALRFYTDFASPEKSVYTWNDTLPDALDAFATGQTALFFGYKFQEADIRVKSQGIDYGIAAMPQVNPNNEINYANYWMFGVAKKSKHANEAWHFLQYAASEKPVKKYLTETNQVSALRNVIKEQVADASLGTFANQALTAQSWYHGSNPQKLEEYFAGMIGEALDKTKDPKEIINAAVKKIQLDVSI